MWGIKIKDPCSLQEHCDVLVNKKKIEKQKKNRENTGKKIEKQIRKTEEIFICTDRYLYRIEKKGKCEWLREKEILKTV